MTDPILQSRRIQNWLLAVMVAVAVAFMWSMPSAGHKPGEVVPATTGTVVLFEEGE